MSTKVSILLASLLLASCATTGVDDDPLEGYNRTMFGINRAVDGAVIKPAAIGYRTVTPVPARRGFARILENLTEPWSAINALLQGKPGRALNSLGRFVVNTTIGVGGLADHATGLGLKPTREDFGQTLATWGVGDGGYLVLPLFGPSTVRDGLGTGVQLVADPQNIAIDQLINPRGAESIGIFAGRAVSARSEVIESGVEAVLDTSADPYATVRSAYRQRRAAAIADQENAEASTDAEVDAALDAIDSNQAPATAPATPGPDAVTTPPTEPQPRILK